MMNITLLSLIFLFSCASNTPETPNKEDDKLTIKTTSVELPPSYQKAQEILLEMTQDEKLQILKSYMTLRALSSGQLSPTESSNMLFTGVPRLGIPSIQLVEEDAVSTRSAAPAREKGEVLKLGSINLIRNFEKEQVYGNFVHADKVHTLMKPGASEKLGRNTFESFNLQDLDLFLVKSGSEETEIKDYVCAIHRKGEQEYICVESKFEKTLQEMGLTQTLPEALEQGKLSQSQIDTLVLRMLAAMHELKIIS